ncbi:MAG: hypothetical protein PHQ43_09690 [Dehalococcoidales bacterium]|nr:hypothetical protein [Dehalococcoidales bacterium]
MGVQDLALIAGAAVAGYFVLTETNMISTIPAQPTGATLGNSIAANGPVNISYEPWSSNAVGWLRKMGYTSDLLGDSERPTAATMQSVLNTHPTILYWLMHGSFTGVEPWGCPSDDPTTDFPENQCLTAKKVASSLPTGTKGKMAFLGSCEMFRCDEASEKLTAVTYGNIRDIMLNSYEVVIGYNRMSEMGRAWRHSLDWQDDFFRSLASGATVGAAYNYAQGRAWAGTAVDYNGNSIQMDLADHIKIKGNSDVRLVV